jgi:hypothetical protein
MAKIDVDNLVNEIKDAATQVINKDIATVKGFSERQVRAIGQQAALVADGILTGQITEETREFFLDGIETMTQNFIDTLQGLFLVTVEKTWNAIVRVIWNAINDAIATTGLVLPVPTKV